MPLDQPRSATATPRRRSPRPVTGPADTDRQFARARQHTWLVRTLRIILPFTAVGVVGLYFASAMISLDVVENLARLPVPIINAENVTMDNPRYEGFTKDGGSYVVRARTARQDFKATELIHLNEISGEMLDARKVKTEMTAARGIFHTKTNKLDLLDGIEISSSDGMAARLKEASILTKRGIILSKSRSLVKVRQGEVSSDQLMIWQKQRKATFAGNVQTRLTPPPKASATAGEASAQAGEAGRPLLLAQGTDEPVEIASNLLRVENLKNVASFVGKVRAVQGDQTLSSERLDVFFASDEEVAEKAATATVAAGRVTRIASNYPIVMTRGEDERVTAQSLDFDVASGIAVLTGDVEMYGGADRSARSNRAEIETNSNTALLTGDVVVKQGLNEIKGQRLLIDRKSGTSLLTSPAAAGSDAGRIFAKLQGSTGGEEAEAKAPPRPDDGEFQGLSAFTFKTDPNAPVDIEADQLAVNETSKTAEFHGDVRASQGGFTIRTMKLIAHYSGNSGLLDPVDPAAQADSEPSGAQLTRISARGKVLVTSSGGQSATGDWAEFDVARNTVTVGGDVILTQGKNIIRGTRLKIDMTNGNSVIETAPEAAGAGWASTLQPKDGSATKVAVPGGVGAHGGRPSAVFYPTQFKQSAKKSGEAEKQSGASGEDATATSGWQATTAPRN